MSPPDPDGLVILPHVVAPEVCAAICASVPPEPRRREHPVRALSLVVRELRDQCLTWTQRSVQDSGIWPDYSLLVVFPPGDSMILHCDNTRRAPDGTWVPNHTPWRRHTSLLYLSACEGGELVFPDLGLRLAPTPGLFVAFPCGKDYAHGVTPITSGHRYALTMWYTSDPQHRERL